MSSGLSFIRYSFILGRGGEGRGEGTGRGGDRRGEERATEEVRRGGKRGGGGGMEGDEKVVKVKKERVK